MSEQSKAREWYLTVYAGMVDKVFKYKPLYEDEPSIHVIEKSAYDLLTAELEAVKMERDEALETNDILEKELERKSKEVGRSEHRGNTVDYIYDKCNLYGNRLSECVRALEIISNHKKAPLHYSMYESLARETLKKIK